MSASDLETIDDEKRLYRPTQTMLFADFWTNYSDTLIIARRRLGKSYFSVMTALLCMYYSVGLLQHLYPGAFDNPELDKQLRKIIAKNQGRGVIYRVMYFLPWESQSKTLFEDAFRPASKNLYHNLPLLKKYPIKMTKSAAVLEFGPHRAQVSHKGIAKEASHQRGIGCELAIIDEIADHKQESLAAVIYPTLKDNDGRILATGTANGSKLLKDLKDNYEANPKRRLWIVDAMQSVKNGDETMEWLEAIVNDDYGGDWNHPTFLREYMCVMDLPVSGAILEDWKPRIVERGEDDKLVISIDVGFNDPYAVLFWAVTPERRMILLDGFRVTQKTTYDVVEMTRERLRERGHGLPVMLIYPHDAQNRNTSSTQTDKQIWASSGIAEVYRKANKYKRKNQELYALQAVSHRVDRSEGVPEDVLVDLRNWKYDIDGPQPDMPVHDEHCHIGDAWAYGALGMDAAMNWLVPPVIKAREEAKKKDFFEMMMRPQQLRRFKRDNEKQKRARLDREMRENAGPKNKSKEGVDSPPPQ